MHTLYTKPFTLGVRQYASLRELERRRTGEYEVYRSPSLISKILRMRHLVEFVEEMEIIHSGLEVAFKHIESKMERTAAKPMSLYAFWRDVVVPHRKKHAIGPKRCKKLNERVM